MSQYTETISLTDHQVGDRWIGVATVGPVTVNGQTPANALTRVRMTFQLGQITYTLDSVGDQGITIDDADSWEASIPARDDFLPRAGKWKWEMEFWQSGYESPWTLYNGVLTVHDELG